MTSPVLEREAARLVGNPRFIVRTLDGPKGRKYATLGLDGTVKWSHDRNAAQLFNRVDARTIWRAASDGGAMVTVDPAL